MEIRGNKGRSEIPVNRLAKVDEVSTVKITAFKAEQVVELPVIKKDRNIRLLEDAEQLSQKIRADWNQLDPSEIAEKIVDLEGKVALLEGTSPAIEKVKAAAEHLHFQFVFPVVLELNSAAEENMPFSFARTVHGVANQVLKTQSFEPVKQLNGVQIDEIIRYAGGNS